MNFHGGRFETYSGKYFEWAGEMQFLMASEIDARKFAKAVRAKTGLNAKRSRCTVSFDVAFPLRVPHRDGKWTNTYHGFRELESWLRWLPGKIVNVSYGRFP